MDNRTTMHAVILIIIFFVAERNSILICVRAY
jgi:hypothetical protein